MLNRLMITAATAALIAGTGFANAQGMNREAPSAGAGTQQSAPSSTATPMNRDSAPEQGTKSTQSDEKMQPKGGKTQQTQGNMKSGSKGEKSAQDTNTNTNTNNNMNKDEKPNNMSSEKAEDRNGNKSAESKGADSKSQTVGQAGAGAKLSGEQRTKITTVIRNQHVAPVTDVNFSISVGTRVPRDVAFHPLPAEIVTIYPDWRGYEFILVNGQILVIDPQSFEIVAVIDA